MRNKVVWFGFSKFEGRFSLGYIESEVSMSTFKDFSIVE